MQDATLARAHLTNSRSKVTQTYATSTLQTGGPPTQTSEAKRTKSMLTSKLNNKTTNAKLESTTYLATQTKQCD